VCERGAPSPWGDHAAQSGIADTLEDANVEFKRRYEEVSFLPIRDQRSPVVTRVRFLTGLGCLSIGDQQSPRPEHFQHVCLARSAPPRERFRSLHKSGQKR
jgi:hypothetical protein